MVMNNVAYDQLTGMPIDPMAKQQMPVDPMAIRQQVPGTPVYNNPMAMNAANGIYGSAQMRQQSVMMVGDLNNDGVMSDYEETRDNAIKEAIAKQK